MQYRAVSFGSRDSQRLMNPALAILFVANRYCLCRHGDSLNTREPQKWLLLHIPLVSEVEYVSECKKHRMPLDYHRACLAGLFLWKQRFLMSMNGLCRSPLMKCVSHCVEGVRILRTMSLRRYNDIMA